MNSGRKYKLEIYRKVVGNRELIIVKNIQDGKQLIKNMPKRVSDVYINRILEDKTEKVNVINVDGRKIEIDKQLQKSGWLLFPKFNYAVGVVFCGNVGILASPDVPDTEAYFIPIDMPIVQMLPVSIVDFY